MKQWTAEAPQTRVTEFTVCSGQPAGGLGPAVGAGQVAGIIYPRSGPSWGTGRNPASSMCLREPQSGGVQPDPARVRAFWSGCTLLPSAAGLPGQASEPPSCRVGRPRSWDGGSRAGTSSERWHLPPARFSRAPTLPLPRFVLLSEKLPLLVMSHLAGGTVTLGDPGN